MSGYLQQSAGGALETCRFDEKIEANSSPRRATFERLRDGFSPRFARLLRVDVQQGVAGGIVRRRRTDLEQERRGRATGSAQCPRSGAETATVPVVGGCAHRRDTAVDVDEIERHRTPAHANTVSPIAVDFGSFGDDEEMVEEVKKSLAPGVAAFPD